MLDFYQNLIIFSITLIITFIIIYYAQNVAFPNYTDISGDITESSDDNDTWSSPIIKVVDNTVDKSASLKIGDLFSFLMPSTNTIGIKTNAITVYKIIIAILVILGIIIVYKKI